MFAFIHVAFGCVNDPSKINQLKHVRFNSYSHVLFLSYIFICIPYNCEDHFHFNSLSAVHVLLHTCTCIYIYMHIISFLYLRTILQRISYLMLHCISDLLFSRQKILLKYASVICSLPANICDDHGPN